MNMTLKIALLALVTSSGLTFATAGQAQDSQCASPGSMTFANIAERRSEIVPSVHRQLSGLGRLAAINKCSIVITCASDPANGEDADKIRNRQCSAARQAIGMFERRNDVRRSLTEAYETKRVSADKGAEAGQVIVSLQ